MKDSFGGLLSQRIIGHELPARQAAKSARQSYECFATRFSGEAHDVLILINLV